MNEVPLSSLEMFRILYRGKLVVLLTTLLGLLVALGLAMATKPVYKTQVLLQPVVDNGDLSSAGGLSARLGGLGALVGLSSGGDASTAQAKAVLTSREFSIEFMKRHGILQVLMAEMRSGRSDKRITENTVFEWFDTNVRSLSEDRKTGLLTLGIEWYNPRQAAEWADALVSDINEHLRVRALAEASENLNYLRKEGEHATHLPIRDAITRLTEAQMKKAMMANFGKEYAFQVLDPAFVPDRPIKPRRVLMAAIGLAVGFIVGCVTVLATAAWRRAAAGEAEKAVAEDVA